MKVFLDELMEKEQEAENWHYEKQGSMKLDGYPDIYPNDQ